MAIGYKFITLFLIIFFLFHTQLFAQLSVSAQMEVRAVVISGSTVAVNNNVFTMNEFDHTPVQYAMISISRQDDDVILFNSNHLVTLVNGNDELELSTTMIEQQNEEGKTELHFSANHASEMKEGHYSGKQITEIIYL